MNRTRVMIVDDHQVVRAGLRTMINGQPDLAVTAEAGSGREAMDQLRQHTVDVLLLDLSLPTCPVSTCSSTPRRITSRWAC